MKSRIQKYREHGSEGFTLIELLIVIIIIGILAAIVVFSVQGVNNTAAKNACLQNANEAQTAVEAYFAQNKSYPSATNAISVPGALIPSFLKTSVIAGLTGGATITYDGSGTVTASCG